MKEDINMRAEELRPDEASEELAQSLAGSQNGVPPAAGGAAPEIAAIQPEGEVPDEEDDLPPEEADAQATAIAQRLERLRLQEQDYDADEDLPPRVRKVRLTDPAKLEQAPSSPGQDALLRNSPVSPHVPYSETRGHLGCQRWATRRGGAACAGVRVSVHRRS